jgi:formylglycine-generating enzyme required for sulfatase activity
MEDSVRLWQVVVLAAMASSCANRTQTAASTDSGADVRLAPGGPVLQAAENELPVRSRALGPSSEEPNKKGARVTVPEGRLVAGSTPGDRGRDPALEPALAEISLGAFTIDKNVYPNDPAAPPVTGIPRDRAAELCSQAGGRLCSELEWERTCKGPENTMYPGGDVWDPACEESPRRCASGFGALGMGAALREWTASDVSSTDTAHPNAAAVRGAHAHGPAVSHRCAVRAAVDPKLSAEDLGFRCCYGPPNAGVVPAPTWQQTFRRAELTPAQVAEMFATVPELAELGHDLSFFKEPDDVSVVLGRGDGGVRSVPNVTFTTHPVQWSPVPGEDILVLCGKAQKSSFVVALYRLPRDRYRVASSFVLKDEKGPIVLGYNGYNRRRLTWSLCWDCLGESGLVTYGDDNRVMISQK